MADDLRAICRISPFSLTLELPCNDGLWQATSAQEWDMAMGSISHSPVKFHETYRSLLSADIHEDRLVNINELSIYFLFTALASLGLDCIQKRQDPFWDSKEALTCLRTLQDEMFRNITLHQPEPIKKTSLMTYHLTAISLCTPLNDLETATNAGFSTAGTTPADESRVAIIRLFTRDKVNVEAASHAVELLRLYLCPISNEEIESSPFETSALYFGLLTLWAYLLCHEYESGAPKSPLTENLDLTVMLDELTASLRSGDIISTGKYWENLVKPVTSMLARKNNANAREYAVVLRTLAESLI
jgi:hypothetical protein